MILNLFYYGHPVLRQRCNPIEKVTDEIRKLAADMVETMDVYNGIGLAAPQIGQSIRIFVLRKYVQMPDGKYSTTGPYCYINPKISEPSEQQQTEAEGCLSIPKLQGNVTRPWKITVEALNHDGEPFTETVEGINARVIMHENDHLNGVLYLDRMDHSEREKLEPALREIKQKYNP